MRDIFISYAHEDKEKAKRIAKAFEQHGWSVWWDSEIPLGANFYSMIKNELVVCTCVIVLWSKYSVASDWVIDEARVGQQRNVLIPIKIDAVESPLGFGNLHCANLVDWDGASGYPEMEKVFKAVHKFLEPSSKQDTPLSPGN